MSRAAIVLAAHGSDRDPAVNAGLADLADRLARRVSVQDVVCAFHQGSPTFATVLDTLDADDITVIPVMTSEGYYSQIVLPRELARNQRFDRVRVTRPVGAHPRIPRLVQGRLTDMLARHGLPPEDTACVVIGHGTRRHGRSGRATVELAESLRDARLCAEVLPAFLDQQPFIEDVQERISCPNLVVVPFLIGGGRHSTRDIPNRLGMTSTASACGRRIIGDIAVGEYPQMIDLLADLACRQDAARTPGAASEVVA